MQRSGTLPQARPSMLSRTWIWVIISLILLLTIAWATFDDYSRIRDEAMEGTEQGAPLPGPVPK